MSTWRELIQKELNANEETWDDILIIDISPSEHWSGRHYIKDIENLSNDEILDLKFKQFNSVDCYHPPMVKILVWTKCYVYFGKLKDYGQDDFVHYMSSVPRNPPVRK